MNEKYFDLPLLVCGFQINSLILILSVSALKPRSLAIGNSNLDGSSQASDCPKSRLL